MTLEELLSKIESSDPSQWTNITRPTFAQDLSQVSHGDDSTSWIELHEHHTLLVLRSDLSISIALGLPHLSDFREPWAKNFPDSQARSYWVDFRYNAVPVLRELTVQVDGGRAGLPVPGAGTVEISERQYAIWNVIDSVSGSGRFPDYFQRAGFKKLKTFWPGSKSHG